MAKVHDADLCDRIRELEKQVSKLEKAINDHHCSCTHYYYQGPQWTYTSNGTSTKWIPTVNTTNIR